MSIDKYVGIPWKMGGRNKEEGLDCWGLVREFYKNELGVFLPAYESYSKLETGSEECSEFMHNNPTYEMFEEVPIGEEQYGDVLFFSIRGVPIHVAIVIENGLMLHANESSQGVVIEKYRSLKWRKRLSEIYRLRK